MWIATGMRTKDDGGIMKKTWLGLLICTVVVFSVFPGVSQAEDSKVLLRGAEVVGGPVTPVEINVNLRDLPLAETWHPGDPVREVPRRFYSSDKTPVTPQPGSPDPLVDLQRSYTPVANRAFTTTVANFDGQGYTGVNPPDPVGDVGPNYYIQAVNGSGGTKITVYNKDGSVASGPFTLDDLGTGSCASGDGDPIVLYDRLAQRWLMQEFNFYGNTLCFYISQGPDPVNDGWYQYAFSTDSNPDYPHIGIWPDAYYTTTNESPSAVYAFDRENMITGGTARASQRFSMTSLAGYGFQTGTPADLDGPDAPPAGAPGLIMRHVDDEAHSNYPDDANHDLLEMFAFHMDWDTPANTTYTQLPSIQITDFNSWLIDYSTFYTVPQPGSSTRLDAIREAILNRLQYRNFGDHESLVGVLPTNINPATSGSVVNAGLRWFELSKTGAGDWSLVQEGTYQPGDDSENRFVGSVAADQSGNIALAYSFTDTDPAVHPSLYYTGRQSTDAAGIMSQPETTLVTGSGTASGRWGDYAAMGVDPIDDCTFWFTGEYQASDWGTQIAAFKFDACGCLLNMETPTISIYQPGDNLFRLSWADSTVPEVSEYRVFRSMSSGGPWDLMDTVSDTSPGTGGGTPYTWDDTSVSGGTTYYYVLRSSDGVACLSDPSNEVSGTATGACTLAPDFDGITGVASAGTSSCGLDLSWDPATTHCGGTPQYNIYRSTTSGFTPDASSLLASGVTGSSYQDYDAVDFATEYYFIVRAYDSANNVGEDNLVEGAGMAVGPGGGVTDYASADTPIDIPDNDDAGITSQIAVASALPIADINVSVDITHTWQGDLHLVLTSPNGTSVTLHDGTGSSADNIQTTYDSETAPDGPGSMSDFDGELMNGTWTLFVWDDAGSDTGTLNSWTLHIEANAPCQPGAAEGIFSDGFDDGSMNQWSWHTGLKR